MTEGGDGAVLHTHFFAETECVERVGVGGRVCGPNYEGVFCIHGARNEGFAVGRPGCGAHGFGVEFEGAEAFSCL